MAFAYEQRTRRFYSDRDVAREYHAAFAGPGFSRAKLVAHRECVVVKTLLEKIPHGEVLDIPSGTGKMAPIFAGMDARVIAGDISPAMLRIARHTYERLGWSSVSFAVVDLLYASRCLRTDFDVVTCIRLLHRVPVELRAAMLEEIAKLAPFAIVSFGIRNSYHNIRSQLRRWLVGGDDIGIETRQRRRDTEELIRASHDIVLRRPVLRGVSSEWIYLLRSRGDRGSSSRRVVKFVGCVKQNP